MRATNMHADPQVVIYEGREADVVPSPGEVIVTKSGHSIHHLESCTYLTRTDRTTWTKYPDPDRDLWRRLLDVGPNSEVGARAALTRCEGLLNSEGEPVLWTCEYCVVVPRTKSGRPARQQLGLFAEIGNSTASEAATTGRKTGSGSITLDNLGAWVVRCNPEVWKLKEFMDDGRTLVNSWAVANNYRSALMERGQRILFWVNGPKDAALERGIWGSGWVTGPVLEQHGDDEKIHSPQALVNDKNYWRDADNHTRAGHRAQLAIRLLPSPLRAVDIETVSGLENLEVLRQPQMSNPSWVTKEQLALLETLLPQWPELQVEADQEIVVGPRGAGFGDARTRAQVEQASMEVVIADYEARGWTVQDVSLDKVGWDLTCTANDGTVHRVEVKGVSGELPTVLLTANEVRAAREEADWTAAVVTNALAAPSITYYDADSVLTEVKPYVYRATLPVE
jgi:hypothetical protein